MKIFNHITSLFMVFLMLITAVPFAPVSALSDKTEIYTLTVEDSCADAALAENSALTSSAFFRTAEFDGCYGNQLSDVTAELYDSMVENYAVKKSVGDYTHTFKTPFIFEAEVSGGTIIHNEAYEEMQYVISYAMQAAMDAFLFDHPEVFWIKSMKYSYSVSASGNSISGYEGCVRAVVIKPTEIYGGASGKLRQYESAVNSAVNSFTVAEKRYDTLKNVHDYICENAWYNLVDEYRVHSSESFFLGDGGVVCEGYAKAFKVICDRLDIPCVLVVGDAGGAHMWNYVQMDDSNWYLVDATWDDQDDMICDTYFLANATTVGFRDVAVSEERTERTDFSGSGKFSFVYPVLSLTGYGAHIHEWDAEYTVDIEPTCTEKGSKSIHCKSCDETMRFTEIPAFGHSWNEGEVSFPSTCKTHGIKTYTCNADSSHQYTEQLAFDKNNHEGGTYLKDNSVATCTSEGYTGDTYCSGCNVKLAYGEIIPVSSHSFTEYFSDGNATCLSDGTKTARCDFCNEAKDTVADEGSKNDAKHKYSVRSGYSATCTEEGERTYVCDVCENAAYMEIIPATGHNGGTATCTALARCDVCDEEYGSLSANTHKSLTSLRAVASTCTKAGLTEGKMCNDCKKIVVAQKTIGKKQHSYETTTVKATLSKNGETKIKCKDCGYVSKTTVIYAAKTIKLSAVSYTYDGKTKTPSVTVKDSKGKKIGKENYTVTYSKGRKTPGKYTVTVTFKGNYSGTKKLTFEILPSKVSLSGVTAGKNSLTALWKTVSGATGYEVQYSTSKKFTSKTTKTATVKKGSAKKLLIKKLAKGKKYYVRVRAYKTVSGKKIYGAWSAVKNIKVR